MDNKKICPVCSKSFTEEAHKGRERIYCSIRCQRLAGARNSYKSNPEKLADYNHKGYLSKELISRYGGKCAICGWRATEELIKAKGRIQYAFGNEIHHIIAVEQGGKATTDNLILLCPNHHKQADLGIISIEELQSYLKADLTLQEQQELKDNAVSRITAALFNE